MTNTLERAVRKVSRLSAREQNAFARWMLRELTEEQRWQITLDRSRGALRDLADEAVADHKAGRTRRINPDRL